MMTNFEIEDQARTLRLGLVGVYNKDRLPRKMKSGGYVINLQDSVDEKGVPLPGTHWTAFYIDGNEAVYFDSFGFPPPQQVVRFLKSKKLAINRFQIQNTRSGVCGYYCIYFLWFCQKTRKVNLANRLHLFLSQFSLDDPTKNQSILERRIRPL